MLTPAEYRDREKNGRIETRRIHLRCPACAQERAFDLDENQLENLRINGHMAAHCSYCGGSSLRVSSHPKELQRASAGPGHPKRVLLAGSDPASLRLVARMLGAWDVAVDVAVSGRQACEQLAARPYDLVVSDFRLPDLSGSQLLELVQQGGYLPPEKILFLAEETRGALQTFLDASGCSYCRKPVSFMDFSEQVEQLLMADDPEAA